MNEITQNLVGQNVFTVNSQTPFLNLNIIDDKPLVVTGKPQTGTFPKWNMTIKLSMAAEILAYLRENEGFIRTNKFANPSKPKPASDPIDITPDSVVPLSETAQTEISQNLSKRRKIQISGVSCPPKDLFKYSPGWHIEKCKRYRPEKTTFKVRNRKSQGCHCPAKLAIKFQEGYHHTDDGSLNVEKFGDMLVMLHWTYNHNHADFYTGHNHNNIDKLRSVIRMAMTNNTWRQIVGQKNPWLSEIEQSSSSPTPVIVDEHRRQIRSLAMKNPIREKSLCLWASEIKKMNGIAEFRDKFEFNTENVGEPGVNPEFSQWGKVWSFWFMSEWQKELLQANFSTLFLDYTEKVCRGLYREDEVYLYTLYVINSVTGQGTPVAFMMTNFNKSEVVSDFLLSVKKSVQFSPKQVIIDRDQVLSHALSDVWNDTIDIVSCRWHISKVLWNEVCAKGTMFSKGVVIKEEAGKEKEKHQEIQALFSKIVLSDSNEIGETRIQEFLAKFQDFPEIVEYTARHWFAKKDFIMNPKGEHSSTFPSNLIESFHNVLVRNFLKKSSKDRPDVLMFKLFLNVEQNYRAEEILVKKVGGGRVVHEIEKVAKAQALKVSEHKLENLVNFVSDDHLEVKSFTSKETSYSVKFDKSDLQNTKCTCSDFQKNLTRCKHIFLGYLWWLRPLHKKNPDTDVSIEQLLDTFDRPGDVEDEQEVDNVIFSDADEEYQRKVDNAVMKSTSLGKDHNGTQQMNASKSSPSTSLGRKIYVQTQRMENHVGNHGRNIHVQTQRMESHFHVHGRNIHVQDHG